MTFSTNDLAWHRKAMQDAVSSHTIDPDRCKAGQTTEPTACTWHGTHHWCSWCKGWYGVPHDFDHDKHMREFDHGGWCACRGHEKERERLAAGMNADKKYGDDRYGMMRVHIADQRATLACKRYTRNHLRAFAKARGLTAARKHDLAWHMAQHGYIDADGRLRDGFPEHATQATPHGQGAS